MKMKMKMMMVTKPFLRIFHPRSIFFASTIYRSCYCWKSPLPRLCFVARSSSSILLFPPQQSFSSSSSDCFKKRYSYLDGSDIRHGSNSRWLLHLHHRASSSSRRQRLLRRRGGGGGSVRCYQQSNNNNDDDDDDDKILIKRCEGGDGDNNNNNKIKKLLLEHSKSEDSYPSSSSSFLSSFQHDIDQCWSTTSWTVNAADDENINNLLRCFNSPAQQAYFALTRALDRTTSTIKNNLTSSSSSSSTTPEGKQIEILRIFSTQLKRGYKFGIYRKKSDKDHSSSINNNDDYSHQVEWTIVPSSSSSKDDEILNKDDSSFELIQPLENYPNTMSIAHHLLDLVTKASENQEEEEVVDAELINSFVEMAIDRLTITLGTDIRSRSSADAAFVFAMAGVADTTIYKLLTMISHKELERVGPRSSFPSKYVLQIIEKLAASGIDSGEVKKVYKVAADLLKSKNGYHDDIVTSLLRSSNHKNNNIEEGGNTSSFGLHSTRPLLWLWRFAARQTKAKVSTLQTKQPNGKKQQQSNLASSATSSSSSLWINKFEDKSLDLVVDIGSGMGVSLLGLATLADDDYGGGGGDPSHHDDDDPNIGSIDYYEQCNFIGCDLSELLVGYCSGIAQRWGITQNVQFVCKSADQFINDIDVLYPGNVKLIMIQFPTPYRLVQTKIDGNAQLPSPSGFMVSEKLLRSIANMLKKKCNEKDGGGYLLIQSNCEDVAVFMKDLAVEKIGMECVDARDIVHDLMGIDDDDGNLLPQRSQEWITMGGKRPMGEPCWSSTPLLPRKGQTETEVACDLQGTPVHRCLLRV